MNGQKGALRLCSEILGLLIEYIIIIFSIYNDTSSDCYKASDDLELEMKQWRCFFFYGKKN